MRLFVKTPVIKTNLFIYIKYIMTYKVQVYDEKWAKVREDELNEDIFNDKNIIKSLIHEFIVMQQSNRRTNIAHTQTRSDVKCSGIKLYKQKWTGRARVWNATSPIRRWWSVAFGPRNNRNFYKDMPKKQRRKALFGALTMKVKEDNVLWLDKYTNWKISTKKIATMLEKLSLNDKKVLIVLPERNDILKKSFANLENKKTIIVNYINPYDLLIYKKIVFFDNSISKLNEIFLTK